MFLPSRLATGPFNPGRDCEPPRHRRFLVFDIRQCILQFRQFLFLFAFFVSEHWDFHTLQFTSIHALPSQLVKAKKGELRLVAGSRSQQIFAGPGHAVCASRLRGVHEQGAAWPLADFSKIIRPGAGTARKRVATPQKPNGSAGSSFWNFFLIFPVILIFSSSYMYMSTIQLWYFSGYQRAAASGP